MPLGCLSDASKMPSWRDLQAAEQPVTADEACHVAVNMCKRVRDASIYASKKYRSSFYS